MKQHITILALLTSLLMLTACGRTIENSSTAEDAAQQATQSASDAENSEDTAEETLNETDEETDAETVEEAADETSPEAAAETAEETAAETPEETEAEKAAETEAETVTETAAAQTEAATEEMNGAPDSDFASIAGDWYIDGDPAQGLLHLEADGTFKSYRPEGFLEASGEIRYEAEEIEGTTNYWYRLYDNGGEYFLGFADDGSSVKTDLYVGNGATPHYQKFGVGGILDDGRGPGEEFVGTWGCGRATLEITQQTDTDFHATIWWSDSAAAHVEWEYPLTYRDGKLVCTGSASKTYVEYASPDAEPEKTVEYTDGSGEFSMQGAGVVWNDLTEHSGNDMVFNNTLPE
ncbi:MAG: hypothetical protein IJ055_09100 [Oscillospiraceae bacterium]|nr:hypothetical protein [Oscillospiraceae bacterium]